MFAFSGVMISPFIYNFSSFCPSFPSSSLFLLSLILPIFSLSCQLDFLCRRVQSRSRHTISYQTFLSPARHQHVSPPLTLAKSRRDCGSWLKCWRYCDGSRRKEKGWGGVGWGWVGMEVEGGVGDGETLDKATSPRQSG